MTLLRKIEESRMILRALTWASKKMDLFLFTEIESKEKSRVLGKFRCLVLRTLKMRC